MAKVEKLLAKMRESPTNVRYSELESVCREHFGEPRTTGGSHAVFKTPWPGDPRVNIQENPNGGCKPYQVKQVIAAIDKLLELQARLEQEQKEGD
ncbi:toxin HicA [Nocardia sp. NPDC058499]|uniref:toxin HicA n=1 Tax=Nocardia sp. NPDC058499 TaxID=3346530 RepID=UPI0036618A8E